MTDAKGFSFTDVSDPKSKYNLSRPANVTIHVSAAGYVGCSFDYPALPGEDWRRGGDGPEGRGERGIKIAMSFAVEFLADPNQDLYELRNRVEDSFPEASQ